MTNPKITVYIVAHNHEKYVPEAIESVLRQTVDSWELLIIDDDSKDSTLKKIKVYQGDVRVRIIKTDGIGLPAVCNLALKEARGDYIIRLDGDDIFDENILLVLSNYLNTHKEMALVFPDYYLIDEFNEIFAYERRQEIYHANYTVDMPPNGACTMVRTEILRAVGGYREDLGAQDGFDIWTKISKEYRTANVNLPLFYYRRHKDNLTNNKHFILNAHRRIKKDAILNKIELYRPIIAVIPCRKNYDFIQNIWDISLNGKTLLEKALDSVCFLDIFDHIIVACDDKKAKKSVLSCNDKRVDFFLRDTKNTIRSKKIIFTLEQITRKYDPENSGITALRYIQSPFVSTDVMEEAIFTLLMNEVDSAIGVEEIFRAIYKRAAYGLELLNPQYKFKTDFDSVYCEANAAFATMNKNFKIGSLTGSKIVNFLVPDQDRFFIDSEQKLKLARIMSKEK